MRLTVAAETFVSLAIGLPVQRWRRNSRMRTQTSSVVGLFRRCGRDERSAKPTGPSASNRATHLFTVLRSMPRAVATALGA